MGSGLSFWFEFIYTTYVTVVPLEENDNWKLLLFLFRLNLWKFQGYDRVAVVSDKIDKQKYTTYLAPHARLPVDLFSMY